VNRCFSPDSNVASITAEEKAFREAVNEEFETVEEATCDEHRLETVLVRVVTDDRSEASLWYKELLDDLYALASLVSSSQKNEQELIRVQQEDPDRVGEVVCDIHTPKTRWSYNSRRIIRIMRLMPYFSKMDKDNMNIDSREWTTALAKGSYAAEQLLLLLPIIYRIAMWITLLQSNKYPSISLVIYMIEDLIKIADGVGNSVDAKGDEKLEAIASKFLAELENEFSEDLNSDYLKLAQLGDPRVALRTASREEAERLLRLLKAFVLRPDAVQEDGVGDDLMEMEDVFSGEMVQAPRNFAAGSVDELFDAEYQSQCNYFISKFLPAIRKKVLGAGVEAQYEFWHGVPRAMDIDPLEFWGEHYQHIELISRGFRGILGHKIGNDSPERSFSKGGIVITPRRCSLEPTRAGKLITSAVRYAAKKKRAVKSLPRIPDLGIIREDPTAIGKLDDSADIYFSAWEFDQLQEINEDDLEAAQDGEVDEEGQN
jgi:hypothetical protein